MGKLLDFIKKLVANKFYGKLTLSFEAGKITHIRKEETYKLDNL